MDERRVNGDKMRARIDEIAAQYEDFSTRVKRILVVLAVAQIGLGVLSVYLLDQNGDRAEENRALIEQVQRERAYSVKFNCNDVNKRNVASKAQLEAFTGPSKEATLGEREMRDQRLAATALLIDRLLPRRDCDELANHLVDGGTGNP